MKKRRQEEPWVPIFEAREDKLKEFKKNFKETDSVFAHAVKRMCNLRDLADEKEVQTVATLMISNKDNFADRLKYLSIMTSEVDLGRNKKLPRPLGGEGGSKLRAVLGIVCGAA